MIWSFVKVALFVAAIAALTLGATWLSDSGEGIRVAVAGMEFTLGALQAAIAAVVLILAVWLFLKVLGFIVAVLKFLSGDETAISRYFDRNRERKGYEALAEGMMALASGEGKLAQTRAHRAERLLHRPELTNLISAQAAEMQGDRKRAIEIYKRLLSDDRTRFAGVRGLMHQKLAEGDTETALRLAEKAFEMKPRHEEVQDILLRLQTESGNWAGARTTLGAEARQGRLPRDVHKRRDALLALQEAKDVFADGHSIEAREAAIAANKASPDLIPAAVMAARSYIAKGEPKSALRVLRKAWEVQPHPDLAAAFAGMVPEESPIDRLARFETLFKANPGAEETVLTRTELLIAAEDFPGARRVMGDLAERHPTARTLTLMAAIARGEGADEAEVRGWLTRAVSASRGPQWICDKCQTVAADWSPVCGACGGFDTLSWREAPDTPPLPHGAEMLPLIVGRPAPVQEEVETPPPPREPVDVTPPEPEPGPQPAPPAEPEEADPFAEPPSVAAARGYKT
ncbi:heme biosynthesis protein HemY [Frigidibacter sp.]|uniref:heme biosynthesis protein HemY n=1 Tax=Frigidibacter sp. TaxID=2586418 RepID=UPI002733FB6C|nr:heme biosynthesis HemY N-terminal domain-containing protein [Frigidibacter sp.]MDP3339383.1 heme biosynthesis HemY N-terminal domain-containing protein [Frigidibacter sp.]